MQPPASQVQESTATSRAVGEAILLVGHGTDDAAGLAEIQSLATLVAADATDTIVEACYLERARPTIAEAFARLSDHPLRRVTVAPLLLVAAGHAQRDIPAAVSQACSEHPDWDIRLAAHLGCHASIVELSTLRHGQALEAAKASSLPATRDDTLLLVVGRGSRDAAANAEVAAFARLLFERTAAAWHEVCFLSLAEPHIERMLDVAERLPFSTIVVQPHLLFRGALLERLRSTVEARFGNAAKRWLIADHLGAHPLLAAAIHDRAAAATV